MDIYKEKVLEIYEDTSCIGEIKNKTHHIKLKNPFCDDVLNVDLKVVDGKIDDAKFKGTTCFVSRVAATSIFEKIKGMKIEEVLKLSKKDVDNLLGIEVSSTRTNCAIFPLDVVKKCLK